MASSGGRKLPSISPLHVSPLSVPEVTGGSPGWLTSKIKRELTADQRKVISDLEKAYFEKKKKVESALPAPAEPTRLSRQRKVDGPTLVSLKLAEMEAGLALVQEIGRALRAEWHRGSLDISRGEYDKTLEDTQKKVNYFLSYASTIRNHRQEILGRIEDDTKLLRIELQDDWLYIDGILRARNPYDATETIKSTRPGNSRFRNALIDKYEAARNPKRPQSELWCPIAGAYFDKSTMRAAHIVKKSVGENAAQALFGEDMDPLGHVWQPANGLLVHRRYEMWLDAGVIAVVPDDGDDALKFVVLDMSAFDPTEEMSIPQGAELDGRRMQFQGDFRPRKRYLYFTLAVSLLRQHARRSNELSKLPHEAKELWLSPGSYLTGSLLLELARQMGFLTPEEAFEFWGMPWGTAVSESDDEIAEGDSFSSQVTMNLCIAQGRQFCSTWRSKRVAF